ncbi:MAG: ABC transporter permease [Muribaculaceae bacterium]|nr:ABC transporter permease [Muribaculaceae bacterium]
MQFIRQILFELRHQSLVTWLSIIGTALAIFLVMSNFMIGRIDSVQVAPETNRPRICYGFGMDIIQPNNHTSSNPSLETAQFIYDNLEGVECVSYSQADYTTFTTVADNGKRLPARVKSVDQNYWKIYDYTFEEGHPFTPEEVEAGVKNIIITRDYANNIFGKGEPAIGRHVNINNKDFIVSGIVKTPNPLLARTSADVFPTHTAMQLPQNIMCNYFGDYCPVLLLKPGVTISDMRPRINHRYDELTRKLAKTDSICEAIPHGQPYSTEMMARGVSTNTGITADDNNYITYLIYAILLLIPAINLSSMTRARMRRRVSEIGLLRAFGCTRGRLILNLLTENFILSMLGGLLGLLLSFIFIMGFSNYFVVYGDIYYVTPEQSVATPSFEMLFSWQAFLLVLAFCFILNLLSAGLPILKAASINPAEALNGDNNHK